MVDKREAGVSLKLLIDEKMNRAVAAEAQKEFVDILLSFLTFPMATTIRITNSEKTKTTLTVGCINRFYQSVQKLGSENCQTEHCKTMLLNPRNPLPNYCNKLKINIDDSGSEKNYLCNPKGAFLRKGGIMFIISDDLQIRPASPQFLAQFLSDLGLNETNRIWEMTIEVSKEEVICLLARSLVLKSPLTDVFLPTSIRAKLERNQNDKIMNLKVTLIKHTNKILFAEATDDFFDFLCTFLTIPIGSVIYNLKGKSGLGCIDNVYTSVEKSDDKWFGPGLKSAILCPICSDKWPKLLLAEEQCIVLRSN